MMGEVILIASGKGGTGKTVFTANIGGLLARRGYKVNLLDLDMGLRNLDLYLGLENTVVYNIMDVLSGMCRIKRALIKDRRFENLYLMAAGPNRDDRDITPLHMQVLCDKLKKSFDYIIIDAPAGISENLLNAAAAADRAVIVTEAEFAALRDAQAMDDYLRDIGIKKRAYVVNKVRVDLMMTGLVPTLSEISSNLRTQLMGIIQYDDNIYISTNKGVPIIFKEGTYIEKNFSNILDRILSV